MAELTTNHFLFLSAALFVIGLMGVLIRRNLIVMFMCVELMMNAVNLSLVAFARETNTMFGEGFVLFTIAVAAAEAAVGLAIILALSRRSASVDADQFHALYD
jgi:NADH-quinone oxidoreductase subunit K